MPRKLYPTNVSDEEWRFVAPYLVLMDPQAPQRQHDLREVFMIRAGAPWRMLPNDLPPWEAVRWLEAGCFEAMVSDLHSVIHVAQGRSAVVFDGRTLQSSCESGPRAGYDDDKRRNGSKIHMGVDTLRHLLALHITPANEQERDQVDALCKAVEHATGSTVEKAWVNQGYAGQRAKDAAAQNDIALEVVKLPEAKKGFVLLPRRWVVERSFGWLARFRRLPRDYERLPSVLSGLHFVIFAILMLPIAIPLIQFTQDS